MRDKITIYIEKCRKDAVIPVYSHEHDAGMDVCSAEEMILHPRETKIIPTGLKVCIPPGYEIQIRPRSGISYRTPLRLSNAPGTIDTGYRDEIGILMTNTSQEGEETFRLHEGNNGHGTYVIGKGERIAQMVLCKVPEMVFEQVPDVSRIGKNRGGGFGSTGIK
ncbi:MAG: aminotransferase [Clostridia bacterium]